MNITYPLAHFSYKDTKLFSYLQIFVAIFCINKPKIFIFFPKSPQSSSFARPLARIILTKLSHVGLYSIVNTKNVR